MTLILLDVCLILILCNVERLSEKALFSVCVSVSGVTKKERKKKRKKE